MLFCIIPLSISLPAKKEGRHFWPGFDLLVSGLVFIRQ